ncbi:MAG: hypothetical protein ACOCQA_02110 [bacterium]
MRSKFEFFIIILLIMLFSVSVSADQIELQNGNSMRGEVQNDSIELSTDYGQLNIQTRYLNKLNKENGGFTARASENNSFSGELETDITVLVSGEQRSFSASEIDTINFSGSDSFNNNKNLSVTLKNGDFFFANTVEDSISISTSLGSSLSINYNSLNSIEYLSEEDIYLVNRNNASEIKSNLSGKKLIIWPAAAEIIEIDFNYIEKIKFN